MEYHGVFFTNARDLSPAASGGSCLQKTQKYVCPKAQQQILVFCGATSFLWTRFQVGKWCHNSFVTFWCPQKNRCLSDDLSTKTMPLKTRPRILTLPVNGHFLSTYWVSLASFGVENPRPMLRQYRMFFLEPFLPSRRFEPMNTASLNGFLWGCYVHTENSF